MFVQALISTVNLGGDSDTVGAITGALAGAFPIIAAVARRAGVVTALDDTYSAGVLFDAFAHGAVGPLTVAVPATA